jgi:hypothetical protein
MQQRAAARRGRAATMAGGSTLSVLVAVVAAVLGENRTSYQLRDADGLCLTVSSAVAPLAGPWSCNDVRCTPLVMAACSPASALRQRWVVTGNISDPRSFVLETIVLASGARQGECVSIANGSAQQGAPAVLAPCGLNAHTGIECGNSTGPGCNDKLWSSAQAAGAPAGAIMLNNAQSTCLQPGTTVGGAAIASVLPPDCGSWRFVLVPHHAKVVKAKTDDEVSSADEAADLLRRLEAATRGGILSSSLASPVIAHLRGHIDDMNIMSMSTRDNVATPQAAPAAQRLPLLFMSHSSDLHDPWGLQYSVSNTATALNSSFATKMTARCNGSFPVPKYASNVIMGGLLSPNPRRPRAGFELFFTAVGDACVSGDGSQTDVLRADRPVVLAKSICYTTTLDFCTYSPPVRSGVINRGVHANGCLVKSLARNTAGTAYTVFTSCMDSGIRPMVATTPWEQDNFTAQSEVAAFHDHDAEHVVWNEASNSWVDLQISFQPQPGGTALKYCDNVGIGQCELGYRRVLTIRTSQNGLNWTGSSGCPGQPWHPGIPGYHSQFQNCTGGFNATGTVAPDPVLDPPELQFYRFTAFQIGSTSRSIGHMLLYAPGPQQDLGPEYGLMRSQTNGSYQCQAHRIWNNISGGACHGPHLGIERWIGPADGDLAAQPLASRWERPFRWSGRSAPARGSQVRPDHDSTLVAVDDWPFVWGGLLWRDQHVFLTNASRNILSTPMYRLIGMYAPANAEFTTAAFRWPGSQMWLNADASFAYGGRGCDEGCQSYVMVEVIDATTGGTLEGFEKEKCVFMDVDGLRLPLDWAGRSPQLEALVALRLYYRDAVVYAVGIGVDGRAAE